jgi:hypothetical protein
MNSPVSFKTAKLLKEKEFHIPVIHNYGKKGELGIGINLALDLEMVADCVLVDYNKYVGIYRQISAPTIAEVVMWIYETHGIWITVDIDEDADGNIIYAIRGKKTTHFDDEFKTPTDAYEAAIDYTLKNLI